MAFLLSSCPGTFCSRGQGPNIEFLHHSGDVVQGYENKEGGKRKVKEQWSRMDDLFCFLCTIEVLGGRKSEEEEKKQKKIQISVFPVRVGLCYCILVT